MTIRWNSVRFSVAFANGRHRSFGVLWVLPFLAIPFAVCSSLFLLNQEARKFARTSAMHALVSFEIAADSTRSHLTNVLCSATPPDESALPTLRMQIQRNTFVHMQEELNSPTAISGREWIRGNRPYFKAVLVDEANRLLPVKVRLRGHSYWHHQFGKPSLRVRIRKDSIPDGRRYVELSRPEDALALKNWLPQQLAAECGLFSVHSDHVRLFINERYYGVYTRSLRMGERLAIENNRLPGTFFKGDTYGKPSLWDSIEAWRIHGEADAGNVSRFEQLLDTLREEPTTETLRRTAKLFDYQTYATCAALLAITGGVHDDSKHNQAYFLCANQGLIEAIPWDVNGYGIQAEPDYALDEVRHPVQRMAFADPRWIHRRNCEINRLLNSYCATDRLHKLIDAVVDRLRPDLESDVHLGELRDTYNRHGVSVEAIFMPVAITEVEEKKQEMKKWVTARAVFLREYLGNAVVHVTPDPKQAGSSIVEISGAIAVEMTQQPDGKGHANIVKQLLYPGLSQPNGRADGSGLSPRTLAYKIDADPDNLSFVNAVSGEPVTPLREPTKVPASTYSLHPSALAVGNTTDVILGPGTIRVASDIITQPGQRLIIRGGTRLQLLPGVGIYSRGDTLIQGTKDRWVDIEPADNQPWSTFGVGGKHVNKVQVDYLRLSGGSVGTDGVIKFKGMFNVYNCPNVVLRHCHFGRNEIGDDAVNLAESHVVIEDCRWNDALADGLDLDLCRGIVRRCKWRNSGNDALDVMGSRILVDHCEMAGSGDKGISVGEQSDVFVSGCTIRNCATGVESKDASWAVVQESEIADSVVAINAYQKKSCYPGGGQIMLVDCILRNSNKRDVTISPRSSATIVRTPVGELDSATVKRVEMSSRTGTHYKRLKSRILESTQPK